MRHRICVECPQDIGGELLRRDDNTSHAVVLRNVRHAVQPPEHWDAVDALATLAGIVIEEAERLQPECPVIQQLADCQLASVTGALNRCAIDAQGASAPHDLERAK